MASLNGRPRTDLVAIVDLGSAAVRFIIARIRPSARYFILVEERVPTRLGSGAPGTLPMRAIARTIRAVHRFFARYSPQRREGPRIVAIATSAVRDARNRERLLDPLRRNEGIEVRILSARDEARLGVAAALESLSFSDALVADLGGASLQLSRVRHRRVISTASLPLGAVRTTSRFLSDNRPKP
ncbi:MAG TPA: exopolyphosphatase, partial [Candidatus Eisenbacteria bacterium]|nr:exopolyphosphatase [Candidatus Eisenbacteria bacterium]